MELLQTPSDVNYTVQRFESKFWELGLRQMIAGVRFCAGVLGDDGYCIQYCAGSSEKFLPILTAAMMRLFENLEETVTPQEIRQVLPATSAIKPIYKCASWQKVQIVHRKLESGIPLNQIPSYNANYTHHRNIRSIALTANGLPIGDTITIGRDGYWEIIYLEIDEAHRRQGLGTYLLQLTCQELWELEFKPIHLTIKTQLSQDWLNNWLEWMNFNLDSDGTFTRKPGNYNYGAFRDFP